MSNRKKPKRYFRKTKHLADVETESQIQLPKSDKVVIKVVPAKADGEDIGQTVFYEDGTFDMIISEGISEKAQAHIAEFKLFMAGED